MEKQQYSIFEENMERLEKKLTRIFNKCKKYGCEFSYRKVGEEIKEVKDEWGRKHLMKFILVEAEGKAIINDWQFVASLEHTEKGNIIKSMDQAEVPERYYKGKPICEHCQSKRTRKYTYIVLNEKTGQFKQVGKSCLNDFTNGLSAEAVAHYISLFDELIQGETPSSSRGEKYFETESILKYAFETVKHYGFAKSSVPGVSTAGRAFDYYCAEEEGYLLPETYRKELLKEIETISFNANSPDVLQNIQDALNWIANQPEENTFIHNLKTICSSKYVSYRNIALLVALIPTYKKDIEYQQKKEKMREVESLSEYVGEIGKRITISVQSVSCITSWESEWGIIRIYKFSDNDGNVYIWKTSSFVEDAIIESVRGTVKEHREYDGTKQTELTRCKITYQT